ncbi:MAG: protoporphyrinogen oxidase [Gammaproteobacteria bacterium]|nr:protoporphyrinogen oxidase [Gammaproteobacteria bacterium]
MKIAIIGAGISGLTTAFYLQRDHPEWDLCLYDACAHPGGTMHTENVEGFLFEAGGNGFLTNKPDSLQLVRDSGADDLLMPSSDLARRRFIYTDRLHRMPETPPMFLKTKLLTWRQKLRVAGEFFIKPGSEDKDETLQEFGNRRLGQGFTDVMLNAMVAGIYATTPDKISVAAAFPLIAKLEREHGGLFRGMIAKRKKGAGPGGILMSFRGGVSAFIRHLHKHLEADWQLSAPVTSVEKDDTGYRVATVNGSREFDQVIISAPAYAASNMLHRLDDELSRRLAAIDYSPIAVVGFGYESLAHDLDGFGLLTTANAGLSILGVLWDSSIFPDRAPPGARSVRVMIGGQRNPELVQLDDGELIKIASEGLQQTMGIDQPCDTVFVKRWPRGIPSYAPGHIDRVDAIFEQLQSHAGLHLSNNAYRGIAMNDAVRQGRELAEQLG